MQGGPASPKPSFYAVIDYVRHRLNLLGQLTKAVNIISLQSTLKRLTPLPIACAQLISALTVNDSCSRLFKASDLCGPSPDLRPLTSDLTTLPQGLSLT